MQVEGLEVNSPEYWELRHQREPWPRTSEWALDIVACELPVCAHVLEIGCGQGAFANALIERRPDIVHFTAVDISPTAISTARELTQRIDFQEADVFRLKEQIEHQYDYIISIQNFEHWPKDQHIPAMRAAWSRLNSGGKFFFTGVGKAWDLNQMNYALMEYNGKTIQVPNDYHYNNWSEQEVYDLFNNDACNAESVKFWRRRRKNRVIAEASKV